MPKTLDRSPARRRYGTFDFERFGLDLEAARDRAGISLRVLAAEFGTSHTVVHRIEKAATMSPDLELVLQLCQRFEMRLYDYFMVPARRDGAAAAQDRTPPARRAGPAVERQSSPQLF